jgi:hypothetical protein
VLLALDDRLAECLDAAYLADGACRIPVADLRALPTAPELAPGVN